MRHEPSFLKDILSACRKIQTIVAATSEDTFLRDEVLPAAVLHHLAVIGEVVSRLSVEFKERHPEVPELQRQVLEIVAIQFPESNPGLKLRIQAFSFVRWRRRTDSNAPDC
jgi:uncharacterized protein with HEPN domain